MDQRQAMSAPEVLLWTGLKDSNVDGLKFRRQHPIGPYVLDFYCPEADLAIEVDGQGHNHEIQAAKDERRDAWLEEQGIRTLRIPARAILGDLQDVLHMIFRAARG
ncbi:MAG: endonuclease domain-containing protein [Caulobacter sp.]|nr:endonuclease domain-containing protein [Caulobacter sp.]